MQILCHRCGEELTGGAAATYCSHCGAPQVYLREEYAGTVSSGAEENTSGTLPPPHPEQVDWQMAMQCAGVVALGGTGLVLLGARFPAMALLSWIWIVSGSVIALGIYQRQRPLARLNARVGARIGLVVGLAMTVALGVAMAAIGLVARFVSKDMGAFDRDMLQRLHAQIAAIPATNPVPPEMIRFFYSPEFVAGMMLGVFATVAGILIALSMAGGAFAGLMRTRARV